MKHILQPSKTEMVLLYATIVLIAAVLIVLALTE